MDFSSVDFLNDMRDRAIEWARGILELGDQVVILDTETTGVTSDAEILSVAGIDARGIVLFTWLVRPMYLPIPAAASAVHHIYDADVEDKPTFEKYVYPNLCEYLPGKVVVAYNADFDRRMLHQTCVNFSLREIGVERWECAMKRYAEFHGEWDSRIRGFRWQKLRGGDHTALGDCRATLALIRRMAECKLSRETA